MGEAPLFNSIGSEASRKTKSLAELGIEPGGQGPTSSTVSIHWVIVFLYKDLV